MMATTTSEYKYVKVKFTDRSRKGRFSNVNSQDACCTCFNGICLVGLYINKFKKYIYDIYNKKKFLPNTPTFQKTKILYLKNIN